MAVNYCFYYYQISGAQDSILLLFNFGHIIITMALPFISLFYLILVLHSLVPVTPNLLTLQKNNNKPHKKNNSLYYV